MAILARTLSTTCYSAISQKEKADEMIIQDPPHDSSRNAEHKSREEQEARANVALVYEHLAAEEIENLVRARSDKESPEVEIVQEKEEETTKDTEVEPDKDTPMGRYGYLFAHLKKRFIATGHPRSFAVRPRDQDDPHDDAHPEGENSIKKQDDVFVYGLISYASDDDEIPIARDEHQYHIDQMKNFLQSDIVWESRKEILVSPHPRKITPLVQSSIVFNDDDIEERTSRWVNKCIKKFNPYARYGVENWKNPHAKIFYIRRQKELGFITEIVARRANDCIVSITEPDYKNLNKNDIEDMYLLIMNNKVPDYANTGLLWSLSVFIRSSVIWERVHDFQLGIESYQQKINLTTPTITFPGIEEYDVFSIVYELVHGIIYTNSKKEKRVMRPSEIHKFCDATLRRTLEGLKSYYNDVKYGYVQKELTNDEVEFS
ncbi:hypothetical protein Tco_1177045 [Tanacetum coccineum]